MSLFARKNRIYLDYASLTPIDPAILSTMNEYSSREYANPSSLYREGVYAKKALDAARKSVMQFLHSAPEQNTGDVIFTSGGTEANNMAILGTVESLRSKGLEYEAMHMIVSAIEHSSVRECAMYLSEKGVEVSVIHVDSHGVVDLDELKKSIKSNTVLVSIMTVNNEIGTIQPIRDIAKIIRHAREVNKKFSPFNFEDNVVYPLLHTDAAQGCLEDLYVDQLGVDLLTLDGTKVYGPRGIGALYIRRGTPVVSIIKGGGQEKNIRSGTENIPGIIGFAKALQCMRQNRAFERERLSVLKMKFVQGLKETKKDIRIHGEGAHVSPHILNVSIYGIQNEFFVLQLDAQGIACSTKSSCLRDQDESYVLKSIGARSSDSVRFSFGRYTTESDIKKALKIIQELLAKKS